MDTPASDTADYPTPLADALASMPVHTFVAAWRAITGEPPAVMLSSRTAMIELLVESMPVLPLDPTIPARNENDVAPGTLR